MSIARLSPQFSVSSQLGVEDLAGLAASGFRAIVNNRPDGEESDQPASAALAAEAQRLGLAYAHIPIVQAQIDDAQVRALARFLAGVDGPALGFCRTGTRSARLWSLAQAGRRPVDEILETAARAGYDLSSLRSRLGDSAA